MPVDVNGNRADVVMDAGSIINRMNIGRFYEHYFASVSREAKYKVKQMLNLNRDAVISIDYLDTLSEQIKHTAHQYLLDLYSIISERQYQFYKQLNNDEIDQHLLSVVNKEVYIYYPIENDKDIIQTIDTIENSCYKPTYGQITYVGNSGEQSITENKVRIAPLYLMALDKIADDWSSVASGKLQHFGILSPIIKTEKFAYPFRNSPVRTISETEGRIFASYCGREAIAEMMDRSNNPLTQRNLIWNLLSTEKPTNVDELVDRNLVTLGGSKPIQLVKHMMECGGFVPVYEPEEK